MKSKHILKSIVIIIVISLTLSLQVFARAGGGGGGSSGGSRHISRGSSSRTTSRMLLYTLAISIVILRKTVFTGRNRSYRRRSIKLIKQYECSRMHWQYQSIQKRVEEAYFQIQECWKRYEPEYADKYISDQMMKEFIVELGRIQTRQEKIVQKHVRLLSAYPVEPIYTESGDGDRIWYLIHGSMNGHYVNAGTGEIVKGKNRVDSFYEYWLFVHEDKGWVLDEIRQKKEWNPTTF